jgi:PKD repeat protein
MRLFFSFILVLLITGQAFGQPAVPTTRSGLIQVDGIDYSFTATPVTTSPAPASPPSVPTAPDDKTVFTMLPFAAVAPAAVHVNALDVPLASGTCITTRYEWDFGDGSPTAHLTGWIAAHVYEAPGIYNISLRLTDDQGHTTLLTAPVTIKPDNRLSLYVSADGDDSNPGTVDRPFRSFAKAASRVRDNTRILFRRGDKFESAVAMTIKSQNVLIGAYGNATEPLPILWKVPSAERLMFSMFKPASDVIIENLQFDGPFAADPAGNAPKIAFDAIYPAGNNITVRNCTFLNVDYCINTDRKVTGMLVVGNSAPLETGVRSYLVWGTGQDHVYLNNRFANSTREHGIRMNDLSRVLIAGNDITNLDRTKTDKSDIAKGCIEFHSGSFAYITGNHVTIGALRVGPRGGSTEAPTTSAQWCVVENNQLDQVSIQVRPGSHHLLIRNNLMLSPEGVKIYTADSAGRFSSDITIDHNTTVAPGKRACFLQVEGKAQQITLTNNLLIAPEMTTGADGSAAVYVGATDLSCFTSIAGNVWPASVSGNQYAGDGLFYIAPKWGMPGGYISPAAWDALPQVKNDTIATVRLDATGAPLDLPAAALRAGAALQAVDRR